MRSQPTPAGGFGRLKAGFVVLVGCSSGLMAVQAGASVVAVGLATLGGLLAGGALLWYLLWIAG